MTQKDERIVRNAIMNNLKEHRKANMLSQQQIADAFQFERSTYSSWETGRSQPNASQLALLALLFRTTVDELITPRDMFNVSSSFMDDVYGDKYLSELSDDEKSIVLKYRLLNGKDKAKLEEFLNSIRND